MYQHNTLCLYSAIRIRMLTHSYLYSSLSSDLVSYVGPTEQLYNWHEEQKSVQAAIFSHNLRVLSEHVARTNERQQTCRGIEMVRKKLLPFSPTGVNGDGLVSISANSHVEQSPKQPNIPLVHSRDMIHFVLNARN